MSKVILIAAGAIVLAVVNWSIYTREQLLAEGQVVLLELAPVDPRSLMQGDYMALRFKAANDAFGRRASEKIVDGQIIVTVDPRGVGTYARLGDGGPLVDGEARIRYRVRNGQPRLATNAFFFEDGKGGVYAKARYGEFRVAADGEAILTGLRDESWALLGTQLR